MKRALVISYYWPPTGGSGVQRWVKFSRHLLPEGWQCVVYTPENPERIAVDESLGREIPPQVEVIRRPIVEPYSLWRRFSGKASSGAEGGEVNPVNAGRKPLGQRVAMWIRGNLFIPDPRFLWIAPSARFLKKYLKEHPVDVIVSTGPPHSMHLIARRLARRTGLPWVADFRDPWTRIFYFKHLDLSPLAFRIHEHLERKVIREADVTVAVSPLVKEEFEEMGAGRVELVTNGFDPADFETAPLPERGDASAAVPEGRKFVVTHTGLFAADGNPDVLWEVLAEKCSDDPAFAEALEIRLAGKNDREILASAAAAGLEGALRNLGYVGHLDAVSEQKGADLLILPLRKEPEYRATLPGKLFEYLASGRPVLGIGQTDGAMARILSETAAGTTFEWGDRDGMRAHLDRCWELFLSGNLSRRALHGEGAPIEKYSRQSTARQMAALLDSLIPE